MVAAAMVWEPASGEEIPRQGALPGTEEIEIGQDTEMSLALDPANGEEMTSASVDDDEEQRQNAPLLEDQAQARRQDVFVESNQDEEEQVERLLERQEDESAIGTQN
jgi:hypothetical protein